MGFPPGFPVDFCIITKNSPVGRPHGRVFFCYTQRSSRATVSICASLFKLKLISSAIFVSSIIPTP